MSGAYGVVAGLAAVCLAVPHVAWSQQAQDAAAPVVEPEAKDALDKMGATLAAMDSFTLHGDVTTEIVLETGQKLQFGGTLDIQAHRPDGLKIVMNSDESAREIYYDGKTLTLFAPRLKYYASVPAPATIGQMLDEAKTKHDIEIPVADLFSWGTDQTLRARIQSGYVIRPEKIGQRTCMHYAFRQELVDWQIWLDESAGNLPCKLVITNRDDDALPQYAVLFDWRGTAPVPASVFAFAPSGEASRIQFAAMMADR